MGVFPSDLIPKMKVGQYSILNLDKSGEPGSHWIAIFKDKAKVWVYDSFGRRSKKIIPLIFKSGNGKVFNTDLDAEQEIHEENCGARSLGWICVVDSLGIRDARFI